MVAKICSVTLSAVTRAPLVSYNGAIAGLHELGPEFMKVFVLPHDGKCYVKNVNRTSVPMLSQDHAGNGWAEPEHEDNSDSADDSHDQVLVRQADIGDKRSFVNISIQS